MYTNGKYDNSHCKLCTKMLPKLVDRAHETEMNKKHPIHRQVKSQILQ